MKQALYRLGIVAVVSEGFFIALFGVLLFAKIGLLIDAYSHFFGKELPALGRFLLVDVGVWLMFATFGCVISPLPTLFHFAFHGLNACAALERRGRQWIIVCVGGPPIIVVLGTILDLGVLLARLTQSEVAEFSSQVFSHPDTFAIPPDLQWLWYIFWALPALGLILVFMEPRKARVLGLFVLAGGLVTISGPFINRRIGTLACACPDGLLPSYVHITIGLLIYAATFIFLIWREILFINLLDQTSD